MPIKTIVSLVLPVTMLSLSNCAHRAKKKFKFINYETEAPITGLKVSVTDTYGHSPWGNANYQNRGPKVTNSNGECSFLLRGSAGFPDIDLNQWLPTFSPKGKFKQGDKNETDIYWLVPKTDRQAN